MLKKRLSAIILVFVILLSSSNLLSVAAYADLESRDLSYETEIAKELKTLGVFKGVSDSDFALDRAPSRVEAIVMLIRALGKESEALSNDWEHPFTDVPEWADRYVGFAYSEGLSNGVSSESFGTGDASSAMYLTFMLRALGYKDGASGDFNWDSPFSLAEETGLITEEVDIDHFLRADVASVSFNALSSKLKDSEKTLADKLIDSGVFTRDDYERIDDHDDQRFQVPDSVTEDTAKGGFVFNYERIPEYSKNAYYVLNGNEPVFSEGLFSTRSFELYGELDSHGRCTGALANIGTDLMPTESRGSIVEIKPTGWHLVRYDELGSDLYLYNRCHLIAYQLTAENANERNLITGTRYMNVNGLLPFENQVAEYVKKTGNHVLYRAVPVFVDLDDVCRGVHLEAISVEDNGKGVKFNIFAYNVQPGIGIDYRNGESWSLEEIKDKTDSSNSGSGSSSSASSGNSASTVNGVVSSGEEGRYVLNLNTHKFHYSYCSSVDKMSEKNKYYTDSSREDIIKAGYDPCKNCNP